MPVIRAANGVGRPKREEGARDGEMRQTPGQTGRARSGKQRACDGSGAGRRGIGLASTRGRVRWSEMFNRKEWSWLRKTW